MRPIILYGTTTLVSGLVAALSIPLLARTLGLSGLGAWGIAESMILLGSQAVLVGTNFSIFEAVRHSHVGAVAIVRAWLPKLAGTYLLALPAVLLCGAAAGVPQLILWLVWLAIGGEALFMLAQCTSRSEGRASRFMALALMKSTAWIGLLLLLNLGHYQASLELVLFARLVSSAVPALPFLRRSADNPIDALPSFKEAVTYGSPIAVASVLTAGSELLERSFISVQASLADAGTYFIACKYAAILTMGLLAPIGLWWPRERARIRDMGEGGVRQLALIQRWVSLPCFAAATAFIFASPLLMPLLLAGNPAPTLVVTAAVVYAALAKGLLPLLGPGAMERGSTWISTVALLLGVTLQAALLLVLVPRLSIVGAAWSSLVGAMACLSVYATLAHIRLPVPMARLVVLALVVASFGVTAMVRLA